MENKHGILLESGTNELEIVEFLVGDNRFAINVIKVKEIIQPIAPTKVPHAHPYIEGIIELRGEVLPLIDLAKALGFRYRKTQRKINILLRSLINKKLCFTPITLHKFIAYHGNKSKSHRKCIKD